LKQEVLAKSPKLLVSERDYVLGFGEKETTIVSDVRNHHKLKLKDDCRKPEVVIILAVD